MRTESSLLENLLIDTWWYGLSARLNDTDFKSIACQRADEGFNAIQLVAGIPPEVAPDHPQAKSIVGAAWDLSGNINPKYLAMMRSRILTLNKLGMTAIVYGAWGMQIEWTGVQFMQRWWEAVITHLDDLDVIYCVTGEVDLWIERPNMLLPDKSTDDVGVGLALSKGKFHHLLERVIRKSFYIKTRILSPKAHLKRKSDWGKILKTIDNLSSKPIILHTGGGSGQHSHILIDNSELLSAVTVQTGHSRSSKNSLWQLPCKFTEQYQKPFINLEPWYEGICNDFYIKDQLYAYWVSILAGASSFAYGAHGIWNCGDGQFLAHWGKQTFNEAIALPTGRRLGQSHKWFLDHMGFNPFGRTKTTTEEHSDELLEIRRTINTGEIIFYPEIEKIEKIEKGEYFDPLTGQKLQNPIKKGPLLIWRPL